MSGWSEYYGKIMEALSVTGKPRIPSLSAEPGSTRAGGNGDWALSAKVLFPGNEYEWELVMRYNGYRTDPVEGIVPIATHEHEYRIKHLWMMERAIRLDRKFEDELRAKRIYVD